MALILDPKKSSQTGSDGLRFTFGTSAPIQLPDFSKCRAQDALDGADVTGNPTRAPFGKLVGA